jgi:hypothetical protein
MSFRYKYLTTNLQCSGMTYAFRLSSWTLWIIVKAAAVLFETPVGVHRCNRRDIPQYPSLHHVTSRIICLNERRCFVKTLESGSVTKAEELSHIIASHWISHSPPHEVVLLCTSSRSSFPSSYTYLSESSFLRIVRSVCHRISPLKW